MSGDQLRVEYAKASAQASQVARQLAFAGVGIVWLFSGATGTASELKFPRLLLWAGMCFVISLGFDLFHAVYRVASFGIYHRMREDAEPSEEDEEPSEELDLPAAMHWPSIGAMVMKLVAVSAGYLFLCIYLIQRIVVS